ncbi:MAG: hypothetical protein P4L99_27955 [Chthoniobacter sp.]|nr:hypothetical protein [Chthoniobacter sp.]
MSPATLRGLEDILALLKATEGYDVAKISDDRTQIVAVRQMLHTWAIVYGLDEYGMDGRYCYNFATPALLAFEAWSGNAGTEPEGWIRHPESGRRRPDGDATKEYVNP